MWIKSLGPSSETSCYLQFISICLRITLVKSCWRNPGFELQSGMVGYLTLRRRSESIRIDPNRIAAVALHNKPSHLTRTHVPSPFTSFIFSLLLIIVNKHLTHVQYYAPTLIPSSHPFISLCVTINWNRISSKSILILRVGYVDLSGFHQVWIKCSFIKFGSSVL